MGAFVGTSLRHPVTAARTVFRKYRMKYEDRGKRIEAGFYYARPRISSFVSFRLFLDDSIFFSTLLHVKGGGGRGTGSRQRRRDPFPLDHCNFDIEYWIEFCRIEPRSKLDAFVDAQLLILVRNRNDFFTRVNIIELSH